MNVPHSSRRAPTALGYYRAHGAFTWGVMDRLLEDGRVSFEGISATSAGAMNAVVYAYGRMRGGVDGARQALHDFWQRVSRSATSYSPLSLSPWEKMLGIKPEQSVAFESLTRMFSPYRLNPLNINPLREVLAACVDFTELKDPGGNNLGIRLPLRGRCGVAFLGKGWAITCETRLAATAEGHPRC